MLLQKSPIFGSFKIKKLKMKNSIFRLSLFLFVITGIYSCDVEPLDDGIAPITDDNPDTGQEPGVSEGNYFPLAVGNLWNYDVSNEDENSQMKILSTEMIGGALYYKVTDLPIGVSADVPEGEFPGLDVRSHIRKNGSDYIQRFYAFIPEMLGGLIPQMEVETFEITFLKDNLAVGQSWVETKTIVTNIVMLGTPQTITSNAIFHSVIESKGETLTVNGTTYTDVIKVKSTATTVTDGETEVSVSENWFAKDVGLIKSYSNDPEDGESDMTLLNYTLN